MVRILLVVEVAIADGARLPNRNNTVIEWNMVVGEGMQCLKNTIVWGERVPGL